MGGICSCFTGRGREEMVDDPGNGRNNYPPFHLNIPSLGRIGSFTLPSQLAPSSPLNNYATENSESFHVSLSYKADESTNSKMQDAPKSQSSDEDVCPTCFEEYTDQNPKIIAKCRHHYHLGCILDWMERSETCPTCRQGCVASGSLSKEDDAFVCVEALECVPQLDSFCI